MKSIILLVFALVLLLSTTFISAGFWSAFSAPPTTNNNNNGPSETTNNHDQLQQNSPNNNNNPLQPTLLGAFSNTNIEIERTSVVILCSSRARRCVPPFLPITDTNRKPASSSANDESTSSSASFSKTDVAEIITLTPRLFLVFADVRSAEAGKFTISHAQRQLNEINKNDKTNMFVKQTSNSLNLEFTKAYFSALVKATLVPCDITDVSGSPSILHCIWEAFGNLRPASLQINKDHNLIFLSGAVTKFPMLTVTHLFEAMVQNDLVGVSCLSLTTLESSTVLRHAASTILGDNKQKSSSKKNNKNNNNKQKHYIADYDDDGTGIIEDPDSNDDLVILSSEQVVYSAGFSRSPKYRSTLGGKLVSLLPNQNGLPSEDKRLKEVLQVDSIDFTASIVTAEAFRQSALHPPLPFERIVEWCPSFMNEMLMLVRNISLSDDSELKEFFSIEERRTIDVQLKRALQWLEGLDSDTCAVRTRYGLRFDEMFNEHVSPVLLDVESMLAKEDLIGVTPLSSSSPASDRVHHESVRRSERVKEQLRKLRKTTDSLLFHLSSLLSDATVQSHIVQGMESVAQLGNNFGALPDTRVEIESSPSFSTIAYPSSTASFSVSSAMMFSSGSKARAVTAERNAKFPLVVVWDQYCCHCCGFSSEIERFVLPLTLTVYLTSHISCFCTGQIAYERLKLEDMYLTPERLASHPTTDVVIWISHAQPYLFAHPLQEVHPIDYHIARMMFEWSRIEPSWVTEIKTAVNEVWVPGEWVKQVFVLSGVPASKLFVIPEAVDTHRFNPEAVRAFANKDIDAAADEYSWNIHCTRPKVKDLKDQFLFFSNFKWEPRKGWDTLLDAYASLAEQHPELKDSVSMYILTFAFDSRTSKDHNVIRRLIDKWWIERKKKKQRDESGYFSRLHRDMDLDEAEDDLELTDDERRQRKEGRYAKLRDLRYVEDKLDVEIGLDDDYFNDENSNNIELDEKSRRKANLNMFDSLHSSTISREWMQALPRLCLIVDIIPDDQMDRLYATADAFVIPTRGEGWGLPIIQSMALAKPVIATRWGGELEFMNDQVSFFIELEGLEQPGGPKNGMPEGSKWALPSSSHLTQIMHYVVKNPDFSKSIGQKAREHIVAHFSDEALRKIVEKRLNVIHDFVAGLYR